MNEPLSRIRSFTGSFTARLFLIGFLIFILLVPLVMIGFLIDERKDRYHEAQNEITSKWGQSQLLIGPVLRVSYRPLVKNAPGPLQYVNIFPENLTIDADANPEVRSRGIFDVLLYTANVKVKGSFPQVNAVYPALASQNIVDQQTLLTFYISDMKGLQDQVDFRWNGVRVAVQPGASGSSYSGLQSTAVAANYNQASNFEITLPLRGSSELHFVPVGKKTSVKISSSWPSPSFNGSFLPTKREVKENGFNAEWDISPFGKDLPPFIVESQSQSTFFHNSLFSNHAFGVDFFFPADFYQKTIRSAKYGVLFVVFTFLTFFLFEVLYKLRVHPFQYLLVGVALSIFYLLLISLSEQIGFLPAYLIASAATIALITIYCMKIFNSTRHGGIIGGVLVVLYAYLYFILGNTDYALLIGSISLFFITALVMYLTRNINWYKVEEH